MTGLRERIRQSPSALFVALAIGTALVVGALAAGSATRSHDPGAPCGVSGVVPLELAGDDASATRIVSQWTCDRQSTEQARARADDALTADSLLFIPGYVLAIAYWCVYGSWFSHRPKSARLALSLAVGTVAAGALDLVENIGLHHVVRAESGWAAVATAASIPKWGLLVAAIPCALVSFCGAWMRWLRHVALGGVDRPEFSGDLSVGEKSVVAPLGLETDEALRRTRRSRDPHGDEWEGGALGVCFSGGGVRAASFALGALHALQTEPAATGADQTLYERSRYLATVSGGGYTGTAAQILARQSSDGQPLPLAPGSDELNLLRQRRRFLWGEPVEGHRLESTREFVSAVLLAFGGITANVVIVLSVGYLVATPVGWFARAVIYPGRETAGGLERAWTTGQRIGWVILAGALVAVLFRYLRRGTGPLPLVAWIAIIVKVTGAVFFVAVATRTDFLGWWTFAVLPAAIAAARVLARAGMAALRLVLHSAPPPPSQRAPTWAAALSGALFGLVASVMWFWADNAFQRGVDQDASALPFVTVAVAAVALVAGVIVAAGLRVVLQPVRPHHERAVVRSSVALSILGALLAGVVARNAMTGLTNRSPGSSASIYLIIAAVVGVVFLTIDQKRWSPHPIYKARLSRTFAMTKDANGKASRLPYRVVTNLTSWARRPSTGPELLICAAVYDSMERRPGEVKAWPFVFSHSHVGGADVGWARSIDFEAALGRQNLPDGTLLAAMSISGAAVSPALGQKNLGPANALIAALNARLGVWLPSPRYIADLRQPGFEAPTWLRIRRFSHLLREMVDSYDLHNRFVYVTDGGQVDNLGLCELLARRCDTIICFDASGDLKPHNPLNTATFDGVRELARRRFGVRFSPVGADQPDGPLPTPDEDESRKVSDGHLTSGLCTPGALDDRWKGKEPAVKVATEHVAAMDIWYPDDDERGRLVFAKCVLTPDALSNSFAYATGRGRKRFPADSTIDQWLDEDQVDAYVELGTQAGARAAHLVRTAWGD